MIFCLGLLYLFSEVEVEDVRTNLVVVYVRKDNVIRVVTVYPCRRIDRGRVAAVIPIDEFECEDNKRLNESSR